MAECQQQHWSCQPCSDDPFTLDWLIWLCAVTHTACAAICWITFFLTVYFCFYTVKWKNRVRKKVYAQSIYLSLSFFPFFHSPIPSMIHPSIINPFILSSTHPFIHYSILPSIDPSNHPQYIMLILTTNIKVWYQLYLCLLMTGLVKNRTVVFLCGNISLQSKHSEHMICSVLQNHKPVSYTLLVCTASCHCKYRSGPNRLSREVSSSIIHPHTDFDCSMRFMTVRHQWDVYGYVNASCTIVHASSWHI